MKSSIAYCGKVTIKVKNKTKSKTRNSGTSELFTIINNILAQKIVSPDSIMKTLPCYITLIHTNDDSINSESFVSNTDYNSYKQYSLVLSPVTIASKDVTIENLKLTAFLTNGNCNISKYNDVKQNSTGYALLLNGQSKILAYTQINLEDLSFVYSNDRNSQAAIEWDMSFSNIIYGG